MTHYIASQAPMTDVWYIIINIIIIIIIRI